MCLSADEITREAACQGQAAAVSYGLQDFLCVCRGRVGGRRGSTAGCLGGEAAWRLCCFSLAGPSSGPSPGRTGLSGHAGGCGADERLKLVDKNFSGVNRLRCGSFIWTTSSKPFLLGFSRVLGQRFVK